MATRRVRHFVARVVLLSCSASFSSVAYADAQASPTESVTMGSLLMLRASAGEAADPVIARSLAHANAGVRVVAARLIAVDKLVALRADVVTALQAEHEPLVAGELVRTLMLLGPEAATAVVDTHIADADWPAVEAFAFGLARWSAGDLNARLPRLIERAGPRRGRLAAAIRLAARLHPSEQDALIARWQALTPESLWIDPNSRETGRSLPSMRTVENLWPGFLASVFAASGCATTGQWRLGGVRLTYGADGRPIDVASDTGQVSEACGRAISALAVVSLANIDAVVTDGALQWTVVPTATAFVTCVDPQKSARIAAAMDDEERVDPLRIAELLKKTRNVSPRYPMAALKRDARGPVIFDTTISTSGCISAAAVLRGADPALDLAALSAVLQWRYQPVVVDRVPVDVDMTVSVEFEGPLIQRQ